MIRDHHYQKIRAGHRRTCSTRSQAMRLEELAMRLMRVQRQWDQPGRDAELDAVLASSREAWHGIQSALAHGTLGVPLKVRENLLILSVYAHSRIETCAARRDGHAVSSLLALTRTLAGSLKEWRTAA
jgi:hypothetical protein